MSHNKEQGYEEVQSNDQLFVFKADFAFLVSLKQSSGVDAMSIAELVNDQDPESIRDVLIASLYRRSGVDADEIGNEEKITIIEQFFSDHGLQECLILAQHLLSYAMIGNIKKKQIQNNQSITSMIDSLLFSRFESFKSHLRLWVYVGSISGLCVCMTIRIWLPHIT